MKHIKAIMQNPALKRQIMLRVYYSYGLSILTNTAFWQAVMLVVSGSLLAKWLHVASIIDNFLAVPVKEVPSFVSNSFLGAISHGEVLTVAVLVLALAVTYLSAKRLAAALLPQTLVTR